MKKLCWRSLFLLSPGGWTAAGKLYVKLTDTVCAPLLLTLSKAPVFCVQELQQFEQYIFSDYSSFIVVPNIYDDVLRNLLSKETETGKYID